MIERTVVNGQIILRVTPTPLDLLGRALEPLPATRRPIQGDIWGDDRAPKPRRDHPGQELIAGTEPATVREGSRYAKHNMENPRGNHHDRWCADRR